VTRVAPDAPVPVVERVSERSRPGGAALAAALAARDRSDVTLIAALGDDDAGASCGRCLRVPVCGWSTSDSTADAGKAAGTRGGQGIVRVDTGSQLSPPGAPTAAVYEALAGAGAVLVADYGRGVTEARHCATRSPMPRPAPPSSGIRIRAAAAPSAASAW
jgi:bifunctional ADP-heptose synthase (sugar kinase/adenylyltransferase)